MARKIVAPATNLSRPLPERYSAGVMNLIWIAALTTMVLIEKVLPRGQWISRSAGVALAGWGVASILV